MGLTSSGDLDVSWYFPRNSTSLPEYELDDLQACILLVQVMVRSRLSNSGSNGVSISCHEVAGEAVSCCSCCNC
jgi:hypothetical protein